MYILQMWRLNGVILALHSERDISTRAIASCFGLGIILDHTIARSSVLDVRQLTFASNFASNLFDMFKLVKLYPVTTLELVEV